MLKGSLLALDLHIFSVGRVSVSQRQSSALTAIDRDDNEVIDGYSLALRSDRLQLYEPDMSGRVRKLI